MKPEETIDFQIKFAWQYISRFYNDIAAKYNTTWASGNVLLNIDLQEGTPATALGPKMGMEATSLSRILKNLEIKGLITREPHPTDRRVVIIKLTAEGIEKRNEARQAVKAFNQHIMSLLTPEQLSSFFQVIQTIVHEIESNNIKIYAGKVNL
ncbi:MAG: MarR family winged helix-turn-helix transcriptional regulator [Thermaurantimonas sp.]